MKSLKKKSFTVDKTDIKLFYCKEMVCHRGSNVKKNNNGKGKEQEKKTTRKQTA